jgi:hypothetical protein
VRGSYTEAGTLALYGTGEEEMMREIELNAATRLLLTLAFGTLKPGEQVFRFDFDPYARSAHYVNTHVLAKSLTEKDILDSLKAGRVFIAFNMLADGRGFVYMAQGAKNKAVMGETIPFESGLKLEAASPQPCRFTILRDGVQVHQEEGTAIEWQPSEAGKYRVEAELNILGEWTPWVYTNPIEVAPAA